MERTVKLESSIEELGEVIETLSERLAAFETYTTSAVEPHHEET
jgi:hypothetical protein